MVISLYDLKNCVILKVRTGKEGVIMEDFLTDDDLFGLLDELNQTDAELKKLENDEEMEASNRRYEEIIQKHKNQD